MTAFPRQFRSTCAPTPSPSLPPTLRHAGRLAAVACLALLATACGGEGGATTTLGEASSVAGGATALQLSATTIPAGGAVTATFSLADTARSASGGVTVYLSFSRAVLAGPRWIRIPNGSRSASFTLRANPYLTTLTAAPITASTSSPDPFTLVSQQVTVGAASPPPATARPDVAAVTFSPATVVSGDVASGTVTLTGPAPAGGAVVQLASSYDLFGQTAEVPATVVVPEGATSALFAVPTHLASSVATRTDLPITGSFFGGPWRGSWLAVVAP
jgi:hypothetical protein